MTTKLTNRKNIFLLALSVFFFFNYKAQVNSYFLTGDIEKDVKSILAEKEVLADVMDTLMVDNKVAEIVTKFQASISANNEWYLEQTKNQKPGEGLPYDKRLVITEEEYVTMREGLKTLNLGSTQREKIKFLINNGII